MKELTKPKKIILILTFGIYFLFCIFLILDINVEIFFTNGYIVKYSCFLLSGVIALILLLYIIFNKYRKNSFFILYFIFTIVLLPSAIIKPNLINSTIAPSLNIRNYLATDFIINQKEEINSKSLLGTCFSAYIYAQSNDGSMFEIIEYNQYNTKFKVLKNLIKNKKDLLFIKEDDGVRLFKKADEYMIIKGNTITIIKSKIEIHEEYIFENFK